MTTIDTGPADPTSSTSASLTYHSSPVAASVECRLDNAAFVSCGAGAAAYPGPLADGVHTFQARGKDAGGFIGNTASYSWRVDTTPPATTIDSHPPDPAPGGSAGFTYHADETGAGFECSLAAGGAADSFSPCPSSGRSYTSLADGLHTFKVRAKDGAGNQGAAASFTWTVDNSLADTTPPDTVIDSGPPNPSDSPNASFTYHSTEPGSSFECRLDAAPFSGCAPSGITYTGLANGTHTFQVRATDASDNTDPTAAGSTFDVAVPAPAPPPPPPPAVAAPPTALALPAPVVPDTRISKRPRRVGRDRTPTVRFSSEPPGTRFQCSVDRGRFSNCRSPFTPKRLSLGRHRIRVRAVAGGYADPSPAVVRFKIVRGRNARHGHRKGRGQNSHRHTHHSRGGPGSAGR